MNNFFNNDDNTYVIQEGAIAKNFIANVFLYMFVGLGITGLAAWYFGHDGNAAFMLNYDPIIGEYTGLNGLGYIIAFAPLIMVFLMGAAIYRMSGATLKIVFFVFATIMGMSLSPIFLAYTDASIATTFFSTAGLFGVMAVLGYTTKTDLTKFGSFMMMALLGIIIASVVNFFAQSSGLYYLISFAGVIIFTGLTAYDVQKLKQIGAGIGIENIDNDTKDKLVVMGALSLYLDFINLFLFLLRFLGNRD